MNHLVPCPHCQRHVRVAESVCPFCHASVDLSAHPEPRLPQSRLGRAALFAFGATVAASLAATACGSDDDGGGSGGSGGSATGGGGSSGSGGSGTGGSGTGGSGTGGSGTGGAGTGGSGTGGTGGGGGNMTPEAFCASYETKCTFSGTDHFTSSQDCKTKYAAFGETQKTCTNTHLGLADSTTSIHCTHAAGQPPCGP